MTERATQAPPPRHVAVMRSRLGLILAVVLVALLLLTFCGAPARADIGGDGPTVTKAEYRWLHDNIENGVYPSKHRVEAVFDTTPKTGKVVDYHPFFIFRAPQVFLAYEHDWYKVKCNAGLVNVWYGTEESPDTPLDVAVDEDGVVGDECGTNNYGARPGIG